MTVGGHLNNLSLFRVNSQAIFTREGQDCVRLDLGRFDGLRDGADIISMSRRAKV